MVEFSQSRTLEVLQKILPDLSPQLRRAAAFVLSHPEKVALGTVRTIAAEADVHPNALIQLARQAGFDGYRSFREVFALHLKDGASQFRGRARALQARATEHAHETLYHDIGANTLQNLERLFSGNNPTALRQAGDAIRKADHAYILGVGVGYSLAHSFWYLAHMALPNVVQIPRPGNLPIDDLARIGRPDVLVAVNFHPYRSDVLAAAELARSRRATLVAITDDHLSPIAQVAHHVFVTPVESPQFFTSIVGAMALMETLLSFTVADADKKVLKAIEEFHRIRYDSGVYVEER